MSHLTRQCAFAKLPLAVAAVSALSSNFSQAQANRTTVIHGRFVEQHYLMETEEPAIIWTNDFTLTLSGKGDIHEDWSSHNTKNFQKTGSHEYSLGAPAGSVTWHVIDANTLRKTITFRQHVQTMTITTSDGKCSLEVKFGLKPGFSDMFAPKADSGEWVHFSLPKTLEAFCTIS